jgi:hypothetical protein
MADDADRAGDFIEACIDRPDEARRMAAANPSVVYLERIGSPMLHWFVIEDFPAAAQLVLDLGVPVDSRDKYGCTPLRYASSLGRLACVRLLLARGADPNLPDPLVVNALHAAITGGHSDVAMQLLDHGARADYFSECLDTVFGAMSELSPSKRAMLMDWLSERGVTRDGLFASLRLDQHGYESTEQAFGW